MSSVFQIHCAVVLKTDSPFAHVYKDLEERKLSTDTSKISHIKQNHTFGTFLQEVLVIYISYIL